MEKKFLLRLKNADLFDLEQTRLEKAAAEGWLPYSMSRRIFTLKRGEPQDIKCRLLFYDVADPTYNARMTELQGRGWTYVSSDGISQTLLTAPKESDAEEISFPEDELKVVNRHRTAQGVVAFACFAALILLLYRSIKLYGTVPINRVFVYAAILAFGVQCVCCCVSHTRNQITITGEAGPRTTMKAYWFHWALFALTTVMLVLAIIMALCYN